MLHTDQWSSVQLQSYSLFSLRVFLWVIFLFLRWNFFGDFSLFLFCFRRNMEIAEVGGDVDSLEQWS